MADIAPEEIAAANTPFAANIIRVNIDRIEIIRETIYNGFLLHYHLVKYGSTN